MGTVRLGKQLVALVVALLLVACGSATSSPPTSASATTSAAVPTAAPSAAIDLIIALLLIVYSSYRQTIAAYPHGGGSYSVAKANLGTGAGLLAAAALLLDYVLVVAIGISAGVGALVSALLALQSYTLPLCLAILTLIALVNLRGVRESGLAFALPTYLFIACMGVVLLIGLLKLLVGGGAVAPVVAPAPVEPGGAPGAGHAWATEWFRHLLPRGRCRRARRRRCGRRSSQTVCSTFCP